MKTNNLRKQIEEEIKKVVSCPVSYRINQEDVFPHCVWTLDSMAQDADDFTRFNYSLSIDIYDRGYSAFNCEEWADALALHFQKLNEAKYGNYPTFYLQSVGAVEDEDKQILHKFINIEVQVY